MKRIIFTLFLIALFLPVAKAEAAAPDIGGYVKTVTGAPVAGIWIKWTDVGGRTRFIQTDTQGYFFFRSWGKLTQAEKDTLYNTMVDTDLDGITDTRQASTKGGGFQCFDNPQTYTAVKPVTATGTFTQPVAFLDGSPLELNNGEAMKQLDILYSQDALSCTCENIGYTGDLAPSSPVVISANARSNGELANGTTVFHAVSNGVEIGNSGEVPLSSKGAGLYGSDWDFTLPAESGQYQVYADFSCDTGNYETYIGSYSQQPESVPVDDQAGLNLGTFNPEQIPVTQCNILRINL